MPSTGELIQTSFESKFSDEDAILEGSALKVIEVAGRRPSNVIRVGQIFSFQIDLEYRGENLPDIGNRQLSATFYVEGLGATQEINVPSSPIVLTGVDPDVNPRQTLNSATITAVAAAGGVPNTLAPGLYRVGAVVEEGPTGEAKVTMSGFLESAVFRISN
jgi:hypothetical protein